MKIKKLNLRNLHTPQSMQFVMDVCSLAQNDEKVAAKFAKQLTIFNSAVDNFDKLLKTVEASEYTKSVTEQRKRSNKSYRVLYNMVMDMNIIAPTSEMEASAHRLKLLMKSYGAIHRKNMTDFMNLAYNVTEDLSSDKYSPDVKALGLEIWTKLLIHEYGELKKLIDTRTKGIETVDEQKLPEARVTAEKSYRDLVDQVNAIANMDSTTDYDAFITEVNQKVAYNKQTVIAGNKRGKTIAKNQEEKTDQQTAEATDNNEAGNLPVEESASTPDNNNNAVLGE